nr:tetratricopeptide repeat protein [Gammaproteobacteria bacterium]
MGKHAGGIHPHFWPGTALAGLVLLSTSLLNDVRAGWRMTAEQRARAYFAEGAYEAAAAEFQDPYRRGVALYRAGRYRAAAQAFAAVARAEVQLDARYNLGNARFQLAEYERAIEAYEAVLAHDPGQDDARHNLELAKRLLRQERAASPGSEVHEGADSLPQPAGDEPPPTTGEDALEAGLPRQEESNREPAQAQRSEGASEQEPQQSPGSESSGDDSGQSEGNSMGEDPGQQSGQEGQEASLSGGGSTASASAVAGFSASGSDANGGTGSSAQARANEDEGGTATTGMDEATADEPDRSRLGDGGPAAEVGDEEHHGEPAQMLPGTPSDDLENADEGEDEARARDGIDRSPGPADGEAVGARLTGGKPRVGDRPPGQDSDPGEEHAASAVTHAETARLSARERPPQHATAGGPAAAAGHEQVAGGEPAMGPPGDQRTSRAVDLSQFDHLRPMGTAAPGAEEAAALGDDQPGGAAAQASPGSSLAIEAWLDRIASNPAALLRSRFLLEEQAGLAGEGGRLSEPRPW